MLGQIKAHLAAEYHGVSDLSDATWNTRIVQPRQKKISDPQNDEL